MKLAIVLGTYNRLRYLQDAVQSVRDTANGIDHTIVAVDGGSTDGSREWLAAQPDVVLIGQRGPLTGAVRAFNLGFGYAIDCGAEYIGQLNDDVVCETKGMWAGAVSTIENTGAAAVAFAFDTWPERGWTHDRAFGATYINYGLIARGPLMAVARSQGDPSGRAFWNPCYHTYAADTEAGVWLHRLGYRVVESHEWRVHDRRPVDGLRSRNEGQGDQQKFYDRWAESKCQARPDWPKDAHKLHLGCGDKRMEGWLNADARASVNPDIVLDVTDMTGVPSNTLYHIYSSHMIEHLAPDVLPAFLGECYRCLRPTGKLTLATISFPKIYENRYRTHSNGSAWNAALYGETNSTDHPTLAHRQAFDDASLAALMRNAGFRSVQEWSPSGYPQIRQINDFAVSCRAVSVLMEGIK